MLFVCGTELGSELPPPPGQLIIRYNISTSEQVSLLSVLRSLYRVLGGLSKLAIQLLNTTMNK